MRRCMHIALTLLVILTLARPFECFPGMFTRKAAACCAKGKCQPSSKADECCKGTVPAGNQLSAPKTSDYASHFPAVALPTLQVVVAPPAVVASFDEAHILPGSPPNSRLNLPLL